MKSKQNILNSSSSRIQKITPNVPTRFLPVHDCFNWLCVAVFLPLEAIFHPIRRLSEEIVKGVGQSSGENQDFIKVITKPFTDKIIRMNIKKVLAEVTKVSIHRVLPNTGVLIFL